MREEVDFLREKYYSSRRFENTTVQTHLNGVSVIFLSFPETPGGESFEGVEFTEAIMANANANGIMANSMRISPGDQLCTVKMGGGEKIIRSDIGGELMVTANPHRGLLY
ncbi:hypothetical protein OIY81_3403 [Cryptosporidium canis]|nr:hypothetical protein OIY81_3403 [Cryptosporidium canis]